MLEKLLNLILTQTKDLFKGFCTHLRQMVFPLHYCQRSNCSSVSRNEIIWRDWISKNAGADPEILERGAALSWPPWLSVKKILGFRWPKKAEITLETVRVLQNIYISIFKFSPFLSIKFINFSKFTHALIKKEKKQSYSSQ